MSFSSKVKAELCKIPLNKRFAAVAECYGILLYANTFTPKQIRIVTESEPFAQRLPKLFRKAFGFSFDREPDEQTAGKFVFQMLRTEKIAQIYKTFGLDAGVNPSMHVNYGVLEEDGDRVAFMRGVFLAGGSVTDPDKRYHLELISSHLKVSREAYALLLDMGFYPKEIIRNGSSILYFKQSDYIEDFLTMIGAPVCAMHVMEAKVMKDFRNTVNRRVNCETANLMKTVDASFTQVAAIRKLQAAGVLKTLNEKLQETARLRMENTEAVLSELAQMTSPPVSKSAINHRMRKLIELAEKL